MEQRQFVYDRVMESSFWGEEFCLETIELHFGIHFAVVDGNRLPLLGGSDTMPKSTTISAQIQLFEMFAPYLLKKPLDDQNKVKTVLWLYLRNKHYEPLYFR
jgi:hypothetical protein